MNFQTGPISSGQVTTTSIANQNKAKTISNGIRDQIEKGGALDEKFVHSTVEKISNGSDGKPASLDNSSDKSLVERGIYLYKDSLRREANTYVKNSHGLRDFRNGASMDANGADGFQATFPSTYSKAQVEQVVSEAFAAAQPQKVSIKYTPIKMGDATGYRVDVVVKDKGDNYSGISFAKEIYMKLRLLNQSAAQ